MHLLLQALEMVETLKDKGRLVDAPGWEPKQSMYLVEQLIIYGVKLKEGKDNGKRSLKRCKSTLKPRSNSAIKSHVDDMAKSLRTISSACSIVAAAANPPLPFRPSLQSERSLLLDDEVTTYCNAVRFYINDLAIHKKTGKDYSKKWWDQASFIKALEFLFNLD